MLPLPGQQVDFLPITTINFSNLVAEASQRNKKRKKGKKKEKSLSNFYSCIQSSIFLLCIKKIIITFFG